MEQIYEYIGGEWYMLAKTYKPKMHYQRKGYLMWYCGKALDIKGNVTRDIPKVTCKKCLTKLMRDLQKALAKS